MGCFFSFPKPIGIRETEVMFDYLRLLQAVSGGFTKCFLKKNKLMVKTAYLIKFESIEQNT